MVIVENDGFKISAFNIQIYGKTKASKETVMRQIVQIIRKYDIVLIQEIRDKSGNSVTQLINQINSDGEPLYDYVISDRLGRTHSKEQYAFVYRKDGNRVVDDYQDEDAGDAFERPPFAVKFHCDKPALKDFVLVGIHIDKDDVLSEMNHLKLQHDVIKEKFNTDNILIMGDFNAACTYISKKKLATSELRSEDFHWLIPDDADTTVGRTDCAYDRFVMTGDEFLRSLVPFSAKVVKFDDELNLTNEEAKAVSDHYPIELSLRSDQTRDADIEVESSSPCFNCCGLTHLCQDFLKLFRK
ncbi:hypothetical protein CAPTEDRAFT_139285 [Capitella teleta]|uniref:Deoxyribonuclease n=1 Tax=Capitella teleta TaxID=283909 RepID=R7TWA6_CAPTE|nr:hypothetical protein CAPTEDRAFT_139285 [Capitella teleta]|eukprot:ELT95265.1 hypothetical protein CAPTEDRAFT_139285 [Capitella teleta]